MSGGEIEQDVILDVDGQAVGRAFDNIQSRINTIQKSLSGIQEKARAAADAFGGSLQKTLGDLNKTVSTLERLQKTVNKYDPAAIQGRQTNAAYQQVREQQEKEIARTATTAWTEHDKQRRRLDVERSRAQRLAEQQLTAQYLADQRAADQARLRDARIFEQNRVKQARDVAQQSVANAPSSQLNSVRDASATNLTALRSQRGTGTAEEQRQLEQNIALEKEYLRLVDQRIAAQGRANARVDKSDAGINNRLDVLNAKADEKALTTQLDLNAAKTRQADLQGSINAQIERTYKLTGEEKIAAEKALNLDLERLKVTNSRVVALELAAKNQAKAEAAANRPQSTGRSGMFGGSGLMGVIGRTAAYGGAATAIYGTISALKDGISSAIEFQDSIAKIGGVAGLTETQETKLAESIRLVAANSRFATNEIADATMTLAQAGFSASDIGKSLQAVANLAAASGVSMQEATDVATSAIGAFQLQTSELPHIADVLSAALNTTKLNIQQVAQGIQYAGQTAYENKISFEELTAAMATMSQAGIKSGSTMGTGLRLFLTDLQAPTKKLGDDFKKLGISMSDIDVKTRGLPAVLATLAQKGFGAADAFAALDKRSAAAYLVLKNNQDVLNKQIVLVNQLGNAAEAAGKASDSLAGEWQRFKNILNENTANAFGPIAKGIQDTLHSFNQISGDQTIRKMRADLDNLDEGSKAWSDQVDKIEAYKQALQENIDVVNEHHDAMEKSKTAVNDTSDAFNQNQQTILSENDAIARLIQHQTTLKGDSGALAAETASLMNRFQGLAAQLFDTASSYDNLLTSMRKVRLESIQLGALKAADQANAFDSSAHAKIGQANSLGSLIMGSGLYNRLPGNVQKAIQYARTHVNATSAEAQMKLGEATNVIANYASDPRSKLQGFEADRLRGYAGNLSGAGVDFAGKADANNSAAMQRYLSTPGGRALMTESDNLVGKPDSVIKAKLGEYLTRSANARKQGDIGAAQAWQFLATKTQAELGSGELPKVQGGGRKKRGSGLANRQERAVDAEAIKADEAELKNSIKGLLDRGGTFGADGLTPTASRYLTPDRLKQNIGRVDGSLQKWIDDRTEQMKDQIHQLKLDPNSGKGKMMMDDLQREIDAKREEVHREIGDLVAKALGKVVDAINKTAARATDAAEHSGQMAQARVTALGRASLAGKVPDYVQQTVERQAAFAKDNTDRIKIGVNEQQLADLIKARDAWGGLIDMLNAAGELSGNDDPALQKFKELDDEIAKLTGDTEELKASFGGEGLIPQSFNAKMQMAINNYREVNHLTASWSDMLSMNLTEGLTTAQGAMTQFFSDIISGNASVAQSFGNMVRTVTGFLSQLIAKMIATKLMEAALNLLAGPWAGISTAGASNFSSSFGATSGADFSGMSPGSLGRIYGGQIPALTGRYITDGVPNRDSVDAKIARGEYVTRKSAVDSVGVDFMNDLNNRGAAALKGFGPKVVLPAPAHQKMSVYVMLPEEKPQMNERDVLVTVANDIYRGGPTKQLIREVSQGG